MWSRIRATLDRLAAECGARVMPEAVECGEAMVGDRRLIDTAQWVAQWRSAHLLADLATDPAPLD